MRSSKYFKDENAITAPEAFTPEKSHYIPLAKHFFLITLKFICNEPEKVLNKHYTHSSLHYTFELFTTIGTAKVLKNTVL